MEIYNCLLTRFYSLGFSQQIRKAQASPRISKLTQTHNCQILRRGVSLGLAFFLLWFLDAKQRLLLDV